MACCELHKDIMNTEHYAHFCGNCAYEAYSYWDPDSPCFYCFHGIRLYCAMDLVTFRHQCNWKPKETSE